MSPGLACSRSGAGLLQDCDLPGMVELVLGYAVKHVGEVVGLPWDPVAQTGFWQSCHRLHELIVGGLGLGYRSAPRGFVRFIDWREIVGPLGLAFLSREAHQGCMVPHSDVQ